MSSVNKVILIGHVGRDPDIRRSNNGDAIVSFSMATTESWRDKNSGERKDKTEWHNIVIFNDGIAKVAEQYVKKGSKIYVEGKMQTRDWTDKDGNQRKVTEVVLNKFKGELTLLDSRQNGDRAPPAGSADDYGRQSSRTRNSAPAGRQVPADQDMDDDIPF